MNPEPAGGFNVLGSLALAWFQDRNGPPNIKPVRIPGMSILHGIDPSGNDLPWTRKTIPRHCHLAASLRCMIPIPVANGLYGSPAHIQSLSKFPLTLDRPFQYMPRASLVHPLIGLEYTEIPKHWATRYRVEGVNYSSDQAQPCTLDNGDSVLCK